MFLPLFSENNGKIENQKRPILPLFSIFLETNGKIGLFLNTLNTPKSPILPLFLPKSGCLGTKKSVVEHVANISSAYHDDEYMVNIRSATPFRSTISNARQTRSLGTPMRLNYKHLYTSGRKQLNWTVVESVVREKEKRERERRRRSKKRRTLQSFHDPFLCAAILPSEMRWVWSRATWFTRGRRRRPEKVQFKEK